MSSTRLCVIDYQSTPHRLVENHKSKTKRKWYNRQTSQTSQVKMNVQISSVLLFFWLWHTIRAIIVYFPILFGLLLGVGIYDVGKAPNQTINISKSDVITQLTRRVQNHIRCEQSGTMGWLKSYHQNCYIDRQTASECCHSYVTWSMYTSKKKKVEIAWNPQHIVNNYSKCKGKNTEFLDYDVFTRCNNCSMFGSLKYFSVNW